MAKGRPPDDEAVREVKIEVRVMLSQRDAWDAAAASAGMTRSEWLRDVADSAAEKSARAGDNAGDRSRS